MLREGNELARIRLTTPKTHEFEKQAYSKWKSLASLYGPGLQGLQLILVRSESQHASVNERTTHESLSKESRTVRTYARGAWVGLPESLLEMKELVSTMVRGRRTHECYPDLAKGKVS